MLEHQDRKTQKVRGGFAIGFQTIDGGSNGMNGRGNIIRGINILAIGRFPKRPYMGLEL